MNKINRIDYKEDELKTVWNVIVKRYTNVIFQSINIVFDLLKIVFFQQARNTCTINRKLMTPLKKEYKNSTVLTPEGVSVYHKVI